jgi:hypothetical protein
MLVDEIRPIGDEAAGGDDEASEIDIATREVVRGWIEQDVNGWRLKAMLGYPPTWRLTSLNDPRSN